MFRARCTRRSWAAAKRLHDRRVEVWPVFGTPVRPGPPGPGRGPRADWIVLGSPHHGPLGRAPARQHGRDGGRGRARAVAIAPRRFRRRAAIDPKVIGVAFDGSSESAAALEAGIDLARAAGARLRVIAVEPSGWSRAAAPPWPRSRGRAGRASVTRLPTTSRSRRVVLHGDPAGELVPPTPETLGPACVRLARPRPAAPGDARQRLLGRHPLGRLPGGRRRPPYPAPHCGGAPRRPSLTTRGSSR